jgi:Tfp pilus assembly protein PilF
MITPEPALLGLGQLAYERGEVDLAQAYFTQVVELNPNQSDALNNLAWILVHDQSAPESALSYAQRAVVNSPLNPDFRHTLSVVLARTPGRQAETREHLQKALALNPSPNGIRARCLLEMARLRSRLKEDYRPVLKEALEIHRHQNVFSAQELQQIESMLAGGATADLNNPTELNPST